MRAGRWLAPGLLLLAASCGRGAPNATAAATTDVNARAGAIAPLPASPSAQYRSCIAAAGPVDPAQASCAQDEIGRIQEALSARWRAAGRAPGEIQAAQQAFESALTQLQPASAVGGTLDRLLAINHAMAVTAARASLLTGGSPAIAAGAKAPGADAAWARSRTTACALSTIGDCARRYDALLSVKEDTAMSTSPSAAPEGLPLPSCAEVMRSGATGAALSDSFDQRYPKVLNDENQIEQVSLAPAQIENIVGYLACVAGRTDGDVGVAETGLTLFASKRHGAAALAALDRLAASGGAEAAAAHDYQKQMRGYLDR